MGRPLMFIQLKRMDDLFEYLIAIKAQGSTFYND